MPDEHPVTRTALEASDIPVTLSCSAVRAVTFQAPGEVRVEERPDPEPIASDDAVVKVEATGICGSDLHIYHGRVAIEPGFVIGHEYVGTVAAAGAAVSEVGVGDRVLGTYCTACGGCFHCRRGEYHKCDSGRVFGHGATLGSLQGTQAELALVPNANLTLRRLPDGLSDEVALFTGGRGVDLAVDAVGHPEALDLACRVARKAGTVSVTGVYAERAEVHMGLVWIKALSWRTGHANVIGHLDRVLAMLSSGVLDPSPLVTHHMSLDEAADAYAIYDRREALKIVLRP